MVELVDTRDLKSLGQKWLCGFESRSRHHNHLYTMKKTHIYHILTSFFILTFLFLITSCGTRKGHFKLEGKFLHMNQGEIYVYSTDGLISGIDTIKIEGGSFAYEIPCEDKGTLVLVFPNYSQHPVFAESGKSVSLKADASHLKEMEVKGNDDNNLMTDFRKRISNLSPPEIRESAKDFITENPESLVSNWLLINYWINNPQANYKEAVELLDRLIAAQPRNGEIKKLAQKLKSICNSNIGSRLPAFTEYDINDNLIASRTLAVSPVSVISVWANWNYESENVQRVLHQLERQSKGQLKLLSINIDACKQDCKNAIKQDSITWPTVCDGEMLEGKLIKQLGLTCIPGNLVIQNGKIIARNLQTTDLENKIKQLLHM